MGNKKLSSADIGGIVAGSVVVAAAAVGFGLAIMSRNPKAAEVSASAGESTIDHFGMNEAFSHAPTSGAEADISGAIGSGTRNELPNLMSGVKHVAGSPGEEAANLRGPTSRLGMSDLEDSSASFSSDNIRYSQRLTYNRMVNGTPKSVVYGDHLISKDVVTEGDQSADHVLMTSEFPQEKEASVISDFNKNPNLSEIERSPQAIQRESEMSRLSEEDGTGWKNGDDLYNRSRTWSTTTTRGTNEFLDQQARGRADEAAYNRIVLGLHTDEELAAQARVMNAKYALLGLGVSAVAGGSAYTLWEADQAGLLGPHKLPSDRN
jgi:hypothetical protein